MSYIRLGIQSAAGLGTPPTGKFYEFFDSDNLDSNGKATFTTRDDAGNDTTYLGGGTSFVESVTGDGVDNTDPVNPVLSFPDADEVDDSTTTNKFATQAQLDQIATNVTDIEDNATDIATNTTNISINTANISNNTSNIATNTANILLKRDLTAQKNSIEDDGGDLQLVGDVASPGNSQYYGTNSSGVRGWQPLLSFNIDLDSAEASVSRVFAGGRTTFTITHNLNTLDLIVQIYRLSDGRGINWRIERTGVNTIEASRAGTVANGQFRILIK